MKKIYLLIIFLIVLNTNILSASVMQCPKCGKKFPDDKYQFCTEDGTNLKTLKVMVVNVKQIGSPEKGTQNNKEKTEQEKQFIKKEEIKKEISGAIENDEKERIKAKAEENTFDYDKTMKAIREYFDKDKRLALFLLDYIYLRFPSDVEVLKLYAEFQISIKQYDSAMEFYKKAEDIIVGRLKEHKSENEQLLKQ